MGWILFFILLVIYIFSKAKSQPITNQNEGEGLVMKEITQLLSKKNYHLFNDITLKFGKTTTQIDHILICKFGVFVIETKHFSGWIYANAISTKWTQVLYRYKNQFQNPLRQNHKHILAVQNILEFIDKRAFHNVVVFTGKAEFKTEKPSNVFFLDELIGFISTKEIEILSDDEILKVIGKVERERYFISNKTDVEHVAMLKARFNKDLGFSNEKS